MKVVVADASPVNYLILIDCIDALQRVYRRIVIPTEVLRELTDPGAPREVAAWLQTMPSWLEVRDVPSTVVDMPGTTGTGLDLGELAAIQIALSERDSLLLIDDAAARSAASKLGLAHTGTIGVLVAASRRGALDLRACVERLLGTNFRINRALLERLLEEES